MSRIGQRRNVWGSRNLGREPGHVNQQSIKTGYRLVSFYRSEVGLSHAGYNQKEERIVGKLVGILRKISNILEKVVGYICIVLVAVMLTVVMAQVTLRAARASVPWSEELSRMLLIWIGMLGAGIAAKQGAHVGVDFIHLILPQKASQILGIVIKGTVIWFLGFFAKHSYFAAEAALRVKATTIDITMYFPKLALPVGSVLILIHLVYLLFADIQELFTPTGKEVA